MKLVNLLATEFRHLRFFVVIMLELKIYCKISVVRKMLIMCLKIHH